jgi:hypothetical protein
MDEQRNIYRALEGEIPREDRDRFDKAVAAGEAKRAERAMRDVRAHDEARSYSIEDLHEAFDAGMKADPDCPPLSFHEWLSPRAERDAALRAILDAWDEFESIEPQLILNALSPHIERARAAFATATP